MFVIDRTRQGTDEVPEEVIEMAGTTGNVYHVTINKLPRCTCPDNMKGNQCKHIVYVRYLIQELSVSYLMAVKVLHNVLKAPEHLQYQLAFLSSVRSTPSIISNGSLSILTRSRSYVKSSPRHLHRLHLSLRPQELTLITLRIEKLLTETARSALPRWRKTTRR